MTVETATYLKQLNPSYPEDGDLIKEGDDHIRLIKRALRNTFKNIDKQVLISSEQLNDLISYRDYVDQKLTQQIDKIYPVGSVYVSVSNVSPSTFLGAGTWEAISQGRVLVGAGTGTDVNNNSVDFIGGGTGGEYTTTLRESNIPSHNHGVTATASSEKVGDYSYMTAMRVTSAMGKDVKADFKKITDVTEWKRLHPNVGGFSTEGISDIGRATTVGYDRALSTFNNIQPTITVTESDWGGDSSHGNRTVPINQVQPFLVVYMWKRTS